MSSVNKVILIGNLGADPEVRYTPKGAAVATINLATNRSWKNRDSGETITETEWHRVVAYDKTAEVLGQYAKKGKPLYVEGRLKTTKYEDKEGVTRYSTQVIVENFQFLGAGDGTGAAAPAAPASSEGPASGAPSESRAPVGLDDFDDDIPF